MIVWSESFAFLTERVCETTQLGWSTTELGEKRNFSEKPLICGGIYYGKWVETFSEKLF